MASPKLDITVRQGGVERVALRGVVADSGLVDGQTYSVAARRGVSAYSDPAPQGFVTMARQDGGWIMQVDARQANTGDFFYSVLRGDGLRVLAGRIDVIESYGAAFAGSPDEPPAPPAAGPQFTKALADKLDGIQAMAEVPQGAAAIVAKLMTLQGNDRLAATAIRDLPAGGGGGGLDQDAVDARITTLRPQPFTATEKAQLAAAVLKLAGIEDDATADLQPSEIVALLRSLSAGSRLSYADLDGQLTGAAVVTLLSNLQGSARLSYTSLQNRLTANQIVTQLRGLTGNNRDTWGTGIVAALEGLAGGARLNAGAIQGLPSGGLTQTQVAHWTVSSSARSTFTQTGVASIDDGTLMTMEIQSSSFGTGNTWRLRSGNEVIWTIPVGTWPGIGITYNRGANTIRIRRTIGNRDFNIGDNIRVWTLT